MKIVINIYKIRNKFMKNQMSLAIYYNFRLMKDQTL